MATPKRAGKPDEQRIEGRPIQDEESIELNQLGYDDIARRAYEIYLARGDSDGNDQDDWLEAERELRETQSTASSE